MAYVTRPIETVIERTKNGEITINLVLTIKLDGGNLAVVVDQPPVAQKEIKSLNIDEKDEEFFDVPNFTNTEVIKFGKKVN